MTKYACVTGRFQPVHQQHLELIEMALGRAEQAIIAITNPDAHSRHFNPASSHRHTCEANPFSYFERLTLLDAALRARGWADRIMVVPFDLTRASCWTEYVPLEALQVVRVFSDWEREKARLLRNAGYSVWELRGDPATRLHASDIRIALSAEADWTRLVPDATIPLLRAMLAARSEVRTT